MLFRPLSSQYGLQEQRHSEPWSAAKAFLETQKHCAPPFAIISQPNHARLAGDIAAALYPEAFGELPAEVIEAIRLHDIGWRECDDQQMQELALREPRPFPEIAADESNRAWQKSIKSGESISPLAAILISRHFERLSAGDPLHQEFAASAKEHREILEKRLGYSDQDLNQWAGALGFCDLLSLYFCCGSRVSVIFPLYHPAQIETKSAPEITLSWQGDQSVFSCPIAKSGSHFSVEATLYRGTGLGCEPVLLEWSL